MLWVASQTNIPAAIVKPIMLLPTCSVKACAKYQLLEESDEQYRSLKLLAFISYMLQGIVPSLPLNISIGAAY